MFSQARLRLTGWYVLILGSIILAFSISLYFVSRAMIVRSHERQVTLLRNTAPQLTIVEFDTDEMSAELHELGNSLLLIDGSLLLLAGLLSFLLAGRTLEPLSQMVDRQRAFVAVASHELKTPLAAMRAELDVALRRDRDAKSYHRTLTSVREEVIRLSALAANLLLVAGSHEKAIDLGQRANMTVLVDQALSRFAPLARQKSLTLTEDLSELTVWGDEVQLRQVVDILIDNAVKYTPEHGRITVTLKARARMAELVVADSGPGIQPQLMTRIFDYFVRANHDEQVGGTGLGLAIAKAILDRHHGAIRVTQHRGRGAQFIASLPLAP